VPFFFWVAHAAVGLPVFHPILSIGLSQSELAKNMAAKSSIIAQRAVSSYFGVQSIKNAHEHFFEQIMVR
jgi:hypothetical protein